MVALHLSDVILFRKATVCLREDIPCMHPHVGTLLTLAGAALKPGDIAMQIAHRLESVMGCDSVAVMHGGRVIECGPPARLLRDSKSHFSALHAKA